MKKIILGLAVIASLSSLASASNNSYHSKKNLSNLQQEYKEDRSITCATFHNCQTIHQSIYQEAGHKVLCKFGYCF
ncbi:hypothetical protein R5Q10_001753 [Campylobacter jejuni]|uniref:Periplasmic protein n=1 Tax=Campylobacter coli TaxID=195 RepID=A0A5Y7FAE6_CAMCO|nr:hypothetical protein [Campylobacter jejuni]EAH7913233.1 hypothetical protein [Campylobacter coli]EGF7486079.1 hypothetical protein [Salmonella enterica subsp. enterica serovar Montevideo]EIT3910925.1 hypothetical protein [Escherichia coli]EAC1393621.1 hypothetical protein [Campylobacter jejuni]EAC1921418.1 hypothetical protein [Campylobacter jejuni]